VQNLGSSIYTIIVYYILQKAIDCFQIIIINTCGHKIRELRLKLGIEQSALAFELEENYNLKLTQSDISEVERGIRGIRDFELVAISRILNVKVDELLVDSDKFFKVQKKKNGKK
jgi:transcriptional regulator with XRE-family HTH domain